MKSSVLPTYDELMQPTLDALRALGGHASNQAIYAWVIKALDLPTEVVNLRHKPGSSLTAVEYRLMWARTYLRQTGYIDNAGRAQWILTELGTQTPVVVPAEIVRTVKAKSYDETVVKPKLTPKANELGLPTSASDAQVSTTPNYPRYTDLRDYLRIVNGVPYSQYRDMYGTIIEQRGSTQEMVDWMNPEEWIKDRLSGDSAQLAYRLWRESHGRLNPRHIRGSWYLAGRHELLMRDETDVLRITARGKEFVEHPGGELEAAIDQYEGVLFILRLVAERGPARRGDLLTDYAEYSRTATTIHSEASIKSYLYDRLRNLIDREFVVMRGQRYEITDSGLAYLERHNVLLTGLPVTKPDEPDIRALAKKLRDQARNELYAYLLEMDPFRFEGLIKVLLEGLGYTNVETTSRTNDKGIDVVANIELGITAVREVVQVKRYRGTIGRVILDQVRGSLYRFGAVRGTIITTGQFSKGAQDAAFELGAAPITLIDGEKLLDLLMDNEIGVRKVTVQYFDFFPDDLDHFDDDPGSLDAPGITT